MSRLDSKKPRTVRVPIAVEDPTVAEREYQEAYNLWMVAKAAQHEGEPQAKELVDQRRDALDGCFESVVLRAIPRARFEELLAKHLTKDGEADTEALRPVLVAECCEAEPDPEVWRERFASPEWSKGEVDALYFAALDINGSRPEVRLGKG